MREVIKVERDIESNRRKKRVAAYARTSANSLKAVNSLSAQISYYRDYIRKNPEWIYAGVYADGGISGTQSDKRKAFKRMIDDCEAGKIDIILVKSISRFARNTVDLLKTVQHLKAIGTEVIFEKEGINSASGDGELMLSILASFAQEESRSISENVKWGIRKRFENGIPNGRVRVFGYKWEGNRLVVVQNEAETVKRIFKDFLDGLSPRAIAENLNEDKITTARGCNWSDFSVRYVLKNVIYTGNMFLQKMFVDNPIEKNTKKNCGELPRFFVENSHEPIINKTTFESVQEEFIKRGKTAREGDKNNVGKNSAENSGDC